MATKKNLKGEAGDLSYAQASTELDEILDAIEAGTADVDELSVKVERAALLIQLCREKLTGTELAVKKVVEQLSATEGGEAEKKDEDEE